MPQCDGGIEESAGSPARRRISRVTSMGVALGARAGDGFIESEGDSACRQGVVGALDHTQAHPTALLQQSDEIKRDPRGTGSRGMEIGVRVWIAKTPSRNATLAGAGMISTCRTTAAAAALKQALRKATAATPANPQRSRFERTAERRVSSPRGAEITLNKRA